MKWQAILPILALGAISPFAAFAADAGAEPDAGDAGVETTSDNSSSTSVPPLECGGDLCDSSTGSTCAMSTPAPAAPIVLIAAAVLPLAALARRRRR